MDWENVGTIETTTSWQFTNKVRSGLFKLKHTTSGNVPKDLIGEICLATFKSGQLEIYSPQAIIPRSELQILDFTLPFASDWFLGIRQTPDGNRQFSDRFYFDWSINIMGLYNPVSISIATANISSSNATVTAIPSSATYSSIAANSNRKGMTLFNCSTASLYIMFGGGPLTLTNFAVKISPNGYYEVPFGWTGIIGLVWDGANGELLVSEFN